MIVYLRSGLLLRGTPNFETTKKHKEFVWTKFMGYWFVFHPDYEPITEQEILDAEQGYDDYVEQMKSEMKW